MGRIQRWLSLAACIVLLAGCIPARSESTESTELFSMSMRDFLLSAYGETMDITRDADGEMLLANGFPVRKVRAAFNNRGSRESFPYETDFFDYPFWKKSTEYDGGLALMSLCMAMSANRPEGFDQVSEDEYDAAMNLEEYLADAGFQDFRSDDYDKVPSMFTISSGMAYRRMEQDGEEPFVLIAVGVCGGKYRNEWQSNMTPGDGEIHKGFQSAAQLVYDRLMGYIAREGFTGRIKVWISGFSRAAAVSNLTAAMLNECTSLRKEDIYAYTFATPAAVHRPPETGYENIFNCLGPMDLVPQVMPADWDYGRYGTDLFFAAPEWNYANGVTGSVAREFIAQEAFGISNQYNPAMNLRLRLLYSMLVDVLEDLETYNARFQPVLVGIMQDKSVNNVLNILRRLLLSFQGIDQEKKESLDNLMDYLLRILVGSFSHREFAQGVNNSGSALMQLFNEHTEDSYFSNALSLLYGFFLKNKDFHYVMVYGPVTVSLRDGISGPELVSVSADGVMDYSGEEDSDELFFRQSFYLERIENTTVIAVPSDRDFSVTWTAERAGDVQCMQAICNVRASSQYSVAVGPVISASAGDQGTAFQQENGQSILPSGFEEGRVEARSLASILGISSVGVNWRVWVMLICAIAGAFLTLLIRLISLIIGRRRRWGFLIWMILLMIIISALETEAAYWFFADLPWLRLIWKAVVALCLLFLYFRLHQKAAFRRGSVFPALALALAADLVITVHFVAGTILFLLCHLALTICFLQRQKPTRKELILWAVISFSLSAVIVVMFASVHGLSAWAVAIYAPVLLLMGTCAGSQTHPLRRAATLMILSDACLGLYFAILRNPLLHTGAIALFYTAMILLVFSSERADIPEAVSRNASLNRKLESSLK